LVVLIQKDGGRETEFRNESMNGRSKIQSVMKRDEFSISGGVGGKFLLGGFDSHGSRGRAEAHQNARVRASIRVTSEAGVRINVNIERRGLKGDTQGRGVGEVGVGTI
jgi:hypothetical protein